jgi:hypothetical protein
MPPQSHRDHGVAARAHWLLDEELAPGRNVREARASLPALLRHTTAAESTPQPPAEPADEQVRRRFVFFVAAFVAALSLSVLLRGIDVGAGEASGRASEDGSVVVTATFADEPRSGQIARLRGTLAAGLEERTSRPAAGAPPKRAAPAKPKQPNPPPPPLDDGLPRLPPLPPPPAPPPLLDLLPALPSVPEVTPPALPDVPTLLEGLQS